MVNSYGKNYKLVIIFLKFVDEVTCWTYTEGSVEAIMKEKVFSYDDRLKEEEQQG